MQSRLSFLVDRVRANLIGSDAVSKEITLQLTEEQASALYRLIYDHGHWESKLLFPVENRLIDILEIDDQVLEEGRADKDKGVSKLFGLFRQQGSQALADALDLGTPEAIKMEALAWQDLEAVWYHVSVRKFNNNDQIKGFNTEEVNRMSASYAKIELLGWVGNDPEPISPTTGTKGTRFSLAINRRWTDASGEKQEETDWFQVVAWGKLAETCLAYISKGRLVFVTGRPQMQQWVSEQGQKQERLQIRAERVIFLDSPETEIDF